VLTSTNSTTGIGNLYPVFEYLVLEQNCVFDNENQLNFMFGYACGIQAQLGFTHLGNNLVELMHGIKNQMEQKNEQRSDQLEENVRIDIAENQN
jgi:hypothetical protein